MPPEKPSIESIPLNIRSLAVIITLVLQLSALIWGAAKIDAAVGQLEQTVGKLVTDVRTIEELNVRVAVLEQLVKTPPRR